MSSVIPARLEFSCGHAALVSLPRLKGESPSQRTDRVNREKMEARGRACDFCGPAAETVLEVQPVQAAVGTSGERNGHHADETKENGMQGAETPSVTRLGVEETPRTFPSRRRRLTDAQELEVTRLYAETSTPVPDISKQFSIGEASVYRIVQRHGTPLRGRIAPRRSARPATVWTRSQHHQHRRIRHQRRTGGDDRRVVAQHVADGGLQGTGSVTGDNAD